MRTPSKTQSEAEQAIGFARGKLQYIGSMDMHRAMRQWLTASGVPGVYAQTLARKVMLDSYNDTTDLKLNALIVAGEAFKSTGNVPATTDETSKESTPMTPAPTATTPVATQSNNAQIDRISRLLGELLSTPTVDADQVNGIVDGRIDTLLAMLPEMIKHHAETVVTVEIKKHDQEAYKIDGYVHASFPTLLKCMSARQANGFVPNIMLVGPTGSGKTHAFLQACKALGIEARTNGAIMMDHQLIGYEDANGNYHTTPFAEAFGMACGYLFDEIDSSDNSPLLALAGALANGKYQFPNGIVERHKDCVIAAAGNTWGLGGDADFVGRNKLDAAIRSRFPVRIRWELDEKLEREMCGNAEWARRVQKARAKAKNAGLKVIIDPRMSQAGAALIASGMTMDETAELTYLADLSQDQRAMIE